MPMDEEQWQKGVSLLRNRLVGPSSSDLEQIKLTQNFFNYLLLNMLRQTMHNHSIEERRAVSSRIIKSWKRNIRRIVSGLATRHDNTVHSLPGGDMMVPFIGDGENMRLSMNKLLINTEREVENIMKNIIDDKEEPDAGNDL